MNATAIINENMTLEEKLKAIDLAVSESKAKPTVGGINVPMDPADNPLLVCDSCQ